MSPELEKRAKSLMKWQSRMRYASAKVTEKRELLAMDDGELSFCQSLGAQAVFLARVGRHFLTSGIPYMWSRYQFRALVEIEANGVGVSSDEALVDVDNGNFEQVVDTFGKSQLWLPEGKVVPAAELAKQLIARLYEV